MHQQFHLGRCLISWKDAGSAVRDLCSLQYCSVAQMQIFSSVVQPRSVPRPFFAFSCVRHWTRVLARGSPTGGCAVRLRTARGARHVGVSGRSLARGSRLPFPPLPELYAQQKPPSCVEARYHWLAGSCLCERQLLPDPPRFPLAHSGHGGIKNLARHRTKIAKPWLSLSFSVLFQDPWNLFLICSVPADAE